MSRTVKVVGHLLSSIAVTIFSAMMTLVFLQVVNRYILHFQLFWTEEVTRLLLVWSVMLTLPLVALRRQEINVELGAMTGAGLLRHRRVLVDGLSILFCTFLVWQGYQFFLRNLPAMSPTLGLSRGWFVAPIPIGAALTILATLVRPGPVDEETPAP